MKKKILEQVYSKNIKLYYGLTIISGFVCDAKLDLENKTSKQSLGGSGK